MRMATILLILLLPALLRAQTDPEIGGVPPEHDPPPPPDLARVCDGLPAGAQLTIALSGGESLDGRWAGCEPGRLFLLRDGRPATVPAVEVLAIWVRGRATGKGFKAGAVAGGLGGGAFMGLAAVVLDGMSEGGAPFVPMVAIGVLGGGLAGGAVGAGMGSALPDWERVYARPGAPAQRPEAPDSRSGPSGFGRLSLLGGGAHNPGPGVIGDTGFAWRLGLRADTPRRFSYGVEAGRYLTGHAERPHAPWPDPYETVAVLHAGGLASLDLLDGPTAPYLVGGLGVYAWDDTFLGWSLGAGLELELAPTVSWIAEYRYHGALQRLTETRPRLETFLGGLSLSW